MAKTQDQKDIVLELLELTYDYYTEALAGVRGASRKDAFLSFVNLFERARGAQFLRIFIEDWHSSLEKELIKSDYPQSEQCQTCVLEILDFLDKGSPDGIRFNFLKSLFLSAATEKITDRNSLLPQFFLKLARGLSFGEIIVLSNNYNLIEAGIPGGKKCSWKMWVAEITKISGLIHPGLVLQYEKTLVEKRLLNPKTKDGSPFAGEFFRLTKLGYAICHLAAQFETDHEMISSSSK